MYIGKFIKQRRISLGLSQAELAKLLSLNSVQLISNIERGRCGFPRRRLKRLSRALLLDKVDLLKVCSHSVYSELCKDLGIKLKHDMD